MKQSFVDKASDEALFTDIKLSVGELQLLVGEFSTNGRKPQNEDAINANTPPLQKQKTKGIVALVCDGVSNALNASDASLKCCEKLPEEYFYSEDSWSTKRALQNAINKTNQYLLDQAKGEDKLIGTGGQWLTTLCGAVFYSATAHIFNIGDSQIGRIRNSHFKLLTRPHNQRIGNQAHVLTRAMGADKHLSVDYSSEPLEEDDLYIISTDGLHDFISESSIQTVYSETKNLSEAARVLAQRALLNGSNDNISCILVKVRNLPKKNQSELYQQIKKRRFPPALTEGQKLEGFLIKKVLHASSRSHLYLAKEMASGHVRVLKMPSQNFEDDIEYIQGFVRESWLGQNLEHDSVMKIFPSPKESKFFYHVCEYIEGKTLRQWIYDNPAPPLDKIRKITQKLIRVLREFKKREITHRDLKPENIMIDENLDIKLIDFGTVSIASLEERVSNIPLQNPTGSVNYLAPESRYHLKSDHRSDQFSLGVVIYEMLTNKLPFPEQGRFSGNNFKPSEWRYRSLLTFRSDIPFWIDLVIKKSTEIDPNFRYESYSELIMDFTSPNRELSDKYLHQPLIERNPVRFWQIISLTLALLLLVSLIVRLD